MLADAGKKGGNFEKNWQTSAKICFHAAARISFHRHFVDGRITLPVRQAYASKTGLAKICFQAKGGLTGLLASSGDRMKATAQGKGFTRPLQCKGSEAQIMRLPHDAPSENGEETTSARALRLFHHVRTAGNQP